MDMYCLMMVFSFSRLDELFLEYSLVCKSWYSLVLEQEFWSLYYQQPRQKDTSATSWLRYYNEPTLHDYVANFLATHLHCEPVSQEVQIDFPFIDNTNNDKLKYIPLLVRSSKNAKSGRVITITVEMVNTMVATTDEISNYNNEQYLNRELVTVGMRIYQNTIYTENMKLFESGLNNRVKLPCSHSIFLVIVVMVIAQHYEFESCEESTLYLIWNFLAGDYSHLTQAVNRSKFETKLASRLEKAIAENKDQIINRLFRFQSMNYSSDQIESMLHYDHSCAVRQILLQVLVERNYHYELESYGKPRWILNPENTPEPIVVLLEKIGCAVTSPSWIKELEEESDEYDVF
jgi:hypothetical protein